MKKTLLSLLCLAALGSSYAVAANLSVQSPVAECDQGCGGKKEKKDEATSACGDEKKKEGDKDASACDGQGDKHKKTDKSE